MQPLEISDECYKFFYSYAPAAQGPRSIVYEAHKTYGGKEKLFFFRKNEAIRSLKNLLYFMKFGDTLVEIRVDQALIDKALDASPDHFVVNKFTTGDIYDGASKKMMELVLGAVRNCIDFDNVRFRDVVIKLIQFRGFDSALYVYEKICEEKNLRLSELEVKLIMEEGRQPWCREIPLIDVNACQNMQEFISLMKLRACV